MIMFRDNRASVNRDYNQLSHSKNLKNRVLDRFKNIRNYRIKDKFILEK